MGIIEKLVEQCRKPVGVLGRVMMKNFDWVNEGYYDWALEYVKNPKGALLDVGCGSGEVVRRLSKHFPECSVTGIDYSEAAVQVSGKRNKHAIQKGNVQIVQGTVENLPFQNESFDTIFAIRTHYFWSDLRAAFTEIHKKLQEGGEFVLITERAKLAYHMTEFQSEDDHKALLNACGFSQANVMQRGRSLAIVARK
ncbi:MAG: class I SAM-dependent methyltransferase [Bacilli bacterium]